MNGFKMMAETYRKAAAENKISQEQADKQIRINEFLSTCTDEDINLLFDTGAFNEIAKSYLRLAAAELVNEKEIDEDQAAAIKRRFAFLFSMKTASEV